MSIEISYKDLKKEMLSGKALEFLFEFVSVWHLLTGELIDMDSEDVVIQVLRRAKRSRIPQFRAIYLHLRAECATIIENSTIACDAMLADQLMSIISEGRTCRISGTRIAA